MDGLSDKGEFQSPNPPCPEFDISESSKGVWSFARGLEVIDLDSIPPTFSLKNRMLDELPLSTLQHPQKGRPVNSVQ